MSHERSVPVQEYYSFAEAWEAATATKSRFDYYQGMERKIEYIKRAERWFVTDEKILYYSYKTDDGVRIVHEASPISILSDGPFQYVQIMVVPKSCERSGFEVDGKGRLRFSGQYSTRQKAIEISKDAEAFAFNK